MRLIDADKLETHEQLEPFGNGNYEYVEVVFKDDIDDAPTIESEQKNGKWISHENYDECSNCHCFTTVEFNYCPHCGTKMMNEDGYMKLEGTEHV